MQLLQISGISSSGSDAHAAASLMMTSFGIPLTSSMPTGFAIGFMKG
jgi:hypothetical protein